MKTSRSKTEPQLVKPLEKIFASYSMYIEELKTSNYKSFRFYLVAFIETFLDSQVI